MGEAKDTPVVLIEVEGGCVQEIFSSEEVRFICLDRDVDGGVPEYLTHVGGQDACVTDMKIEADEAGVIKAALEEIGAA